MNTETSFSLEELISATVQKHRDAAYRSIEDHMCTAYEEIARLLASYGPQYLPTRSVNGISARTIKTIFRLSSEGKAPTPDEDCLRRISSLEFIKARSLAFEAQRIKYPNYLKPWKQDDDERLERLWCEGVNISNLAKIFKRNPGAIRSRIDKLELEEKYGRKE